MQLKALLATSLLFAGSVLANPAPIPQAASSTDTSTTPAQTVPATQLCQGTKTWVVNVSDTTGALAFSPNNVAAAAGECVQFQFWPNNHSVVQSAFATPCQPIQNDASAFYSGFMPVDNTTAGKLVYTIKVTDTQPKWFYCAQGKHCQAGMVGAINAPSNGTNTVAAFAAAAQKATTNEAPGSSGTSSSSGSAASPSSSNGAIAGKSAASPLNVDAARNGAWGMALLGALAFLFF